MTTAYDFMLAGYSTLRYQVSLDTETMDGLSYNLMLRLLRDFDLAVILYSCDTLKTFSSLYLELDLLGLLHTFTTRSILFGHDISPIHMSPVFRISSDLLNHDVPASKMLSYSQMHLQRPMKPLTYQIRVFGLGFPSFQPAAPDIFIRSLIAHADVHLILIAQRVNRGVQVTLMLMYALFEAY